MAYEGKRALSNKPSLWETVRYSFFGYVHDGIGEVALHMDCKLYNVYGKALALLQVPAAAAVNNIWQRQGTHFLHSAKVCDGAKSVWDMNRRHMGQCSRQRAVLTFLRKRCSWGWELGSLVTSNRGWKMLSSSCSKFSMMPCSLYTLYSLGSCMPPSIHVYIVQDCICMSHEVVHTEFG